MEFYNRVLKERKYYSNGNIEYIAISYDQWLITREFFEELDEKDGSLRVRVRTVFENQYKDVGHGETTLILKKILRTVYDEFGNMVLEQKFDNTYADDYKPLVIDIDREEASDGCTEHTEYYSDGKVKKMINYNPNSHVDYLEFYDNGKLKAEIYRDNSMLYSYEDKFDFYQEFPIARRVFDEDGKEIYVLYFDVHSKYKELHLKNIIAKKNECLTNNAYCDNHEDNKGYYLEVQKRDNKEDSLESDYYKIGFDVDSMYYGYRSKNGGNSGGKLKFYVPMGIKKSKHG